VAQDGNINLHFLHVAELLVHVDNLWNCTQGKPGCTLDYVTSAVQQTLGQRGATHQMLHKVEALKVCVDIDSHLIPRQVFFVLRVALRAAISRYTLVSGAREQSVGTIEHKSSGT
jgi:hypothetical protein